MFNSDYLPTLTTSDISSILTPINLPSKFFCKGVELLNGIESTSAFKAFDSSTPEGDHKLKFRLPGYEKNEIKISIENEKFSTNFRVRELTPVLKLTVTAENKEEGLTKLNGYFPASIDESTIEAKLHNGILTIFAKTDPQKKKNREIKII
jgi:HSP20 family molecular chaperone IbpA